MSGTLTLPGYLSLKQVDVGPRVTISSTIRTSGTVAGLPTFPLSSDPSQQWLLVETNGTLSWSQVVPPPTQTAIGLEDGAGEILLEDGNGHIIMES
jgi:hypothetical protein